MARGTVAAKAKRSQARKPQTRKPSRQAVARASAEQRSARRGAWIVGALVFVVVGVPLITALVVMRSPRWYPMFDWAQIELRVRDVGTRHSPLIGLPGRLDAFGVIGSHPGPLSFYALAPVYRLLGGSSWAMLASNAALNAAAVGTAAWIAWRRGRWPLALGITAMLGVLVHAYGAEQLTVPWLPWTTMLWWFVFLLAAWSVLCDDLPLLPVMVAVGVFCVQTHISYLGLVGGVGAPVVVWLAVRERRRRRAGAGPTPGLARWARWSAGLLVLLWLPVLIDQAINDPGNLRVLWDHFTKPDLDPVGMAGALSAWWAHLDPSTLVTGHQRLGGSPVPGALLLVAWLGSAAAAWRWRDRYRDLVALHAVVAGALVFGLLSMSRVLGALLGYLVLWAWGTTALLVIAVVWTAAIALTRVWDAPRLATAACVGIALVAATASTAAATRAEVKHPGVSRSLAAMMPEALRKLPRDGRYYVSWQDSFADSGTAFSLLLELERAGFTAGMDPENSVMARPHGVLASSDATALFAYLTGPAEIAGVKATPGAVELAHYEPPPAHTRELARRRAEVARALDGLGDERLKAKLRPLLDDNLFRLATHPDLPRELLPTMERMLDLSVPASLFLVPLR
jgi:hypothetical protein